MKNFGIFKILSLITISGIVAFLSFYFQDANFIKPVGYGYKKSTTRASGDIPNFSLLDNAGNFQELYRQTDVNYILLVATDLNCSSNKELFSKLKSISDANLKTFFITANDHSYRSTINNQNFENNTYISYLIDPSHSIIQELDFKKVGDYILISKDGWKKISSGNLFNKINSTERKNESLTKINNLSFEKNTETCALTTRAVPSKISYEKEIAPIMAEKCLNCHSKTGEIPPYFDSYEKIKNWSEMSKETLLTQRMPPISYDPLYGSYINDISLTDDEKFLLLKWYKMGSPKDGILDPIKNFQVKEPRHVKAGEFLFAAEMNQPHKIPPGGEIEYKYFQLGGPVPFDMWVKGYKTISSNPRQLHHESLMITSKPLAFYEKLANKIYKRNEKEEEIAKNTDGDIFIFTLRALEKYEHNHAPDTYLRVQTWGAGRRDESFYPKKMGAFIPKGSYLILETHYMGTGRTEYEKSKIEFYGSRIKPPKMNAIHAYSLVNSNFEIPANVKNFEVRSPSWSPSRDIFLVSFLGHLHMRGKSVRLDITSESGETKTLISIPNFYYGWQTGSSLRPSEPILVKATDKLQTICYYDNSIHNPFNPDPNKKVKFGQRVDRTEMCKMNFGYIYK